MSLVTGRSCSYSTIGFLRTGDRRSVREWPTRGGCSTGSAVLLPYAVACPRRRELPLCEPGPLHPQNRTWLSAVPMSLRPKGEIQGDFRLTLGNHPPSLSLDHKCCFARQSNVCLGDGAPLESKHRRLCGKALQLPLTNWDKTRYIFAGKFTH